MANILPSEFKKKNWRIQRARYILVLSIMLGALAFVGAVALAPSYLALEIASPQVVDVPTVGQRDATDPLAVARANALLTHLTAFTKATSSPSELLEMVIDARTPGVTIEAVSFFENESRISVSGTGSREGINAYRNALNTNPVFSSVSVPVGALVGSDDGRFSITITLI